jgi:hypothetical protein
LGMYIRTKPPTPCSMSKASLKMIPITKLRTAIRANRVMGKIRSEKYRSVRKVL